MTIRVDLAKTLPMRNTIGTCLVNSLVRCILNSESLTLELIKFTRELTHEDSDIYIEKYGNSLFEHMKHVDSPIKFLLGLYCDACLKTHRYRLYEDILKRIYFIGATSMVNETLYKKYIDNGIGAPDFRSFLRATDLKFYKTFPKDPKGVSDILLIYPNIMTQSIVNEEYICTDIILRKIDKKQPTLHHVVFYNVLENIMQDNEQIYYVPYVDLYLSDHKKNNGLNAVFNGYSYSPMLYHFQNMRGYKTRICSFLTQTPSLINLKKRIQFLIDYVSASSFPYKENKEIYIASLKSSLEFYSKTHKKTDINVEHFKRIDGYNSLETLIQDDGTFIKTSKMFESVIE